MMMGFWLLVPLFLFGVGVLVIGGVVCAIGWRPRSNTAQPTQPSQPPEEILKERFARGEITREEYEQIHRDLEG